MVQISMRAVYRTASMQSVPARVVQVEELRTWRRT